MSTSLSKENPLANRWERHRLIAHLSRMFMGRYDIQVLPSGQKGVWACGLDPKVFPEIEKYVEGTRATLDDLPPEMFKPKQILYDDEAAETMELPAVTSTLRHEASHGKETDFPLMFQGQRQAKDEGYLPSSFWMMWEGLEDPRVNNREGAISPAIDRLIRSENDKTLSERMGKEDFSKFPKSIQYSFNSLHYWLHGEPMPNLDPQVISTFEETKDLLDKYYTNTDLADRKVLQQQLWEKFKPLAVDDVKNEQMREMAKQQGMKGDKGQSGKGQPQPGQGGQEGESQEGEGEGQPGQSGEKRPGQSGNQSGEGGEPSESSSSESSDEPGDGSGTSQSDGKPKSGDAKGGSPLKQFIDDLKNPKDKEPDLSDFSDEQLEELKKSIEHMSPEDRKELEKKARGKIDEKQLEELKKQLPKMFKLEKNKKTGEYELKPNAPAQKQIEKGTEEVKKAEQQTDAEDKRDQENEAAARKQLEKQITQSEAIRKEKLEMAKAGFTEAEREDYHLYQRLEDSIYSHVMRFIKSISDIIPRRSEPVWDGEHFSGQKVSKRELVRRAPVGDERFHMRMEGTPTGTPRLFIGILVDKSTSMRGKKMEEARKTVIFAAKVCRVLGIPFMGTAFGDDAEVFKGFRQDFDNPAERIKPKMIKATTANGGSTNLFDGIDKTIEAMNEERRIVSDAQGIILVITDGQANAGKTGSDLRAYIEERRGRLHFKALGLSANESERTKIRDYLAEYFGDSNCAFPETFEDLPDETYRIFRVTLTQFQKLLQ